MPPKPLPSANDLHDRLLGCLLGGAIGDAMGGAYEGQPRPTIVDAPPWRLSDDTQLTLATCEALVEAGGVFPSVIAEHFRAWFAAGQLTGLGASTLKALRDLSRGQHWATVGAKGERAAGNGAAMRVAPLAFLLDPADWDDRQTLRDLCRITHHHDEAYTGALAVVAATRLIALPTWTWERSLSAAVADGLPDSVVRDRLRALAQLELSLPEIAAQFGASGYVAESVPLAIAAVQTLASHDFMSMMQAVIAVGGDTDTNAAIAGQIGGAWLGASQIPTSLVEQVPERESITRFAAGIARVAAHHL